MACCHGLSTPHGRPDQGSVCVCMLLVALMQSDRDEWSWIALFQQQHGIQWASGGGYLHRKPKERRDGDQVGREGKGERRGRQEWEDGRREIMWGESQRGEEWMQVLKWAGRRGGIPQFSLQMYLYGGESGGITKTRHLYGQHKTCSLCWSLVLFIDVCLFGQLLF